MSEIKIINEKEVFEVIKSATNKLCNMVRLTFGPASHKVIIDKFAYKLGGLDDGVQIARDFQITDNPAENAIITLIRETAIKTNDRAGDGTTGALIILQAIINEVAKKSQFDGHKIEKELKKGLEEVKKALIKSAKEIKTKEDLKKVALVAFDSEKIAELLADTYHKLGKDGIITIDKSPTMETTEGIKLDNGYISPYMVIDPSRMQTVVEKPYILITDYRLTEISDIFPIIDKLAKENKRSIVVIADNVEQSALSTFMVNLRHVKNAETGKLGSFQGVAIVAPSGDNRTVVLEDLALLTGAKVFTQAKGDKLENAEIKDLGRCEKFICREKESIVIDPKGKKGDRAMAITSLRQAIENEKEEKKKKEHQRRLGFFTNTLAVIKVGAITENEQKTLKYKVENAIATVKRAYQHGVLAGSGLALANVKTSSKILNEALQYPRRQLLENMMLDEIELKNGEAYNMITHQKGQFMQVGVVDSIDVLLAGVECAISISSLLLSVTGMEVEYVKKNENI